MKKLLFTVIMCMSAMNAYAGDWIAIEQKRETVQQLQCQERKGWINGIAQFGEPHDLTMTVTESRYLQNNKEWSEPRRNGLVITYKDMSFSSHYPNRNELLMMYGSNNSRMNFSPNKAEIDITYYATETFTNFLGETITREGVKNVLILGNCKVK